MSLSDRKRLESGGPGMHHKRDCLGAPLLNGHPPPSLLSTHISLDTSLPGNQQAFKKAQRNVDGVADHTNDNDPHQHDVRELKARRDHDHHPRPLFGGDEFGLLLLEWATWNRRVTV